MNKSGEDHRFDGCFLAILWLIDGGSCLGFDDRLSLILMVFLIDGRGN